MHVYYILIKLLLKDKAWPGTVACVYNPSYSVGGDQEDSGSRPAWGKQ
jgi:hypothetical protein